MKLRRILRRLHRRTALFVWRGAWFDRYVDAMVFQGVWGYRQSEKYREKWREKGLEEAKNLKKFYFYVYQMIESIPWHEKVKIFFLSAILRVPAKDIKPYFFRPSKDSP